MIAQQSKVLSDVLDELSSNFAVMQQHISKYNFVETPYNLVYNDIFTKLSKNSFTEIFKTNLLAIVHLFQTNFSCTCKVRTVHCFQTSVNAKITNAIQTKYILKIVTMFNCFSYNLHFYLLSCKVAASFETAINLFFLEA